jgi:hypothetical protein
MQLTPRISLPTTAHNGLIKQKQTKNLKKKNTQKRWTLLSYTDGLVPYIVTIDKYNGFRFDNESVFNSYIYIYIYSRCELTYNPHG